MSALPMPDLQLATMASESAYADATRPALGLLVVYTAMGAICAPLLLALFYFSTARSRRTPLFIIVVFDVVLGIALSAWMVIEELNMLLHPLTANLRFLFISIPLVTLVSNWVVDLVLLVRLYAVFPPSSTRRRAFYAVCIFAFVIKAARLACCLTNSLLWIRMVLGFPPGAAYTILFDGYPASHPWLMKGMYSCDLLDHLFVASCFLWKLRVGFSGPATSSPRDDGLSFDRSLLLRIRSVFYIALGNFIFPILFNIYLLIAISVPSFPLYESGVVIPVNLYVTIFGVVFATVWSSSYYPSPSPPVLVHDERATTHPWACSLRPSGNDVEGLRDPALKDTIEIGAAAETQARQVGELRVVVSFHAT